MRMSEGERPSQHLLEIQHPVWQWNDAGVRDEHESLWSLYDQNDELEGDLRRNALLCGMRSEDEDHTMTVPAKATIIKRIYQSSATSSGRSGKVVACGAMTRLAFVVLQCLGVQ